MIDIIVIEKLGEAQTLLALAKHNVIEKDEPDVKRVQGYIVELKAIVTEIELLLNPNQNSDTLPQLNKHDVVGSALAKVQKRFDDCEALAKKFNSENLVELLVAATYVGQAYTLNNEM